MTHKINPRVLTAFDESNLKKLLDILIEHRHFLAEGNAFEYWEKVVITTPAIANTEFSVKTVNLGRTPALYLIMKKDRAVDIYTGDTDWSKDKLYLKATVASAILTLLVVS